MDSLNKARDLRELYKRLSWQIPEVKGVSSTGASLSHSPNRALEMASTTTEIHSPKSPHALNFRLSAKIPDGRNSCFHLNDPKFLSALATAITDKLPDLLDDALKILNAEVKDAFLAAEKELQYHRTNLEALRPDLQQELTR